MPPASDITPADQTAMTMERTADGWLITIEQGNGDEIRTLKLTGTEHDYLAFMVTQKWPHSVTFQDKTR